MTDTPLTRAARAVAKYTDQRMPYHGDVVTCEGIARVVLEAIREPSEDMIAAGINQADECTAEWSASSSCVGEHCWKAMIDTALSE